MAEKEDTQGQKKKGAADPKPTMGQKNKGEELPGAAANLPQTGLTMEQIQIRESYLECAKDFFSKEEMIKFMSDKHGVTKNSVAAVFEEMMKGHQKAEIDVLLTSLLQHQ